MEKFIFDGAHKLFIAKPGVTTIDVKVDLYSDWKEELHLSDNMKWLQAMRVIGGDPKGVGTWAGATVFLMHGWKIRPQETDHTLTLAGDLWLDSDTHPGPMFAPTLGGYTVVVDRIISTLVETIATGGGDPSAIAEAVWDEQSSLHVLPGSMAKEVVDTKNLAQAVYEDIGDVLDMATDLHAEAFGKWVLDPVANTLTLYHEDGSVLTTFRLTTTAASMPAYVARIPL